MATPERPLQLKEIALLLNRLVLAAGAQHRYIADADLERIEQQIMEQAEQLFALGQARERERQWQPIESAPTNVEVLFWVRPLTAEETFHDTSGNPILSQSAAHLHRGRKGSWGSLFTATHWMPTNDPKAPGAHP